MPGEASGGQRPKALFYYPEAMGSRRSLWFPTCPLSWLCRFDPTSEGKHPTMITKVDIERQRTRKRDTETERQHRRQREPAHV